MTALTRNGPKLIFYPGRHGLNRIDLVDSVLTERCGWLEKNIFFEFSFFLIFWIFINNNRNKITFEKILVDPKLGYNRNDENILEFSGLTPAVNDYLLFPWHRVPCLCKILKASKMCISNFYCCVFLYS